MSVLRDAIRAADDPLKAIVGAVCREGLSKRQDGHNVQTGRPASGHVDGSGRRAQDGHQSR